MVFCIRWLPLGMVALNPVKSQKHITSLNSFQTKRPLDSDCLQYEVGSTDIFAERVGMVTLQVRSSECKVYRYNFSEKPWPLA